MDLLNTERTKYSSELWLLISYEFPFLRTIAWSHLMAPDFTEYLVICAEFLEWRIPKICMRDSKGQSRIAMLILQLKVTYKPKQGRGISRAKLKHWDIKSQKWNIDQYKEEFEYYKSEINSVSSQENFSWMIWVELTYQTNSFGIEGRLSQLKLTTHSKYKSELKHQIMKVNTKTLKYKSENKHWQLKVKISAFDYYESEFQPLAKQKIVGLQL